VHREVAQSLKVHKELRRESKRRRSKQPLNSASIADP
jgi:hypothetical protein